MSERLEVTVVICAHNPRPDKFSRVIEALRHQTLPPIKWELLLVDNASDSSLSRIWNIAWHPNARHIREDQLGIAVAHAPKGAALAEALIATG